MLQHTQGELEENMGVICNSAETSSESTTVMQKCTQIMESISKKCEEKATELREKFSRKRAVDTRGDHAPPNPKKPRIVETVRNNTVGRDTAILGLIKAGAKITT
jgi:hypothetical protein